MLWSIVIRLWPWIAGAALVLVAILWFRHQLHEADQAGYERATAEFADRLRVSAEEGRKAVQQAQQEADEANERQRAEYETRYDQVRQQHQAAVNESAHRLEEWQRRYQRALMQDSSCAKWSVQPVSCPL